MADPVSWIGIGISGVGLLHSMEQNRKARKQHREEVNRQAQMAESYILEAEASQGTALMTQEATLDALETYQQEAETLRGSQKVAFAANGIKLNTSTSVLDVENETIAEANKQLENLAREGEASFDRYFSQAAANINQANILWEPATKRTKEKLAGKGRRDPTKTDVYDWLKGDADSYWNVNATDYFLI